MSRRFCESCFQKQQRIDRLLEENERLRKQLRQQRDRAAAEGFFGSSTPSSRRPVKANTRPSADPKRRGGQSGHPGAGRPRVDEAACVRTEVVPPAVGEGCPRCGGPLEAKGFGRRVILESQPVKAEPISYRLPKHYCPRCRKTFQPPVPGALPKSRYGNQLIATAAAMHYLHGLPLGRVSEQTGIEIGSLVGIFHRLARVLAPVTAQLAEWYRRSPVRHADETGWRTEGQNGYAWLFATTQLSLFQFQRTRSGQVARAMLGTAPLPGVLVVDRYAGYNRAPCAIQYCYAHLLREVQDLETEFPEAPEVHSFVATVAPLLTLAMGLRGQKSTDALFRRQAKAAASRLQHAMARPAQHLGVRRIQDIFTQNAHRLYHWATDRHVPADNNLAERDLRPTVIARKVSFGSQSNAGAHTRGVLMSILCSLRKQSADPVAQLKRTLDALVSDIRQDPFPLLFPNAPPPPVDSS